jgi:hypothetical protein
MSPAFATTVFTHVINRIDDAEIDFPQSRNDQASVRSHI